MSESDGKKIEGVMLDDGLRLVPGYGGNVGECSTYPPF
jgi:hypothetical protein